VKASAEGGGVACEYFLSGDLALFDLGDPSLGHAHPFGDLFLGEAAGPPDLREPMSEDFGEELLFAFGHGGFPARPLDVLGPDVTPPRITAIAPLLDRPFAFFGHSMGALIAYQLTRRLPRQGEPIPTWLGVSAYGAPQGNTDADSRPHLMADDELRAWLRSSGGSPPQLLDNDDVWHTFAPVLRSDFTLVDTWAPPLSPEPLPVPLSVFAGMHDKLIDEDRLFAWRALTTNFRGLHRYEGGHFYLTADPPFALIDEALGPRTGQGPRGSRAHGCEVR
jgi:surfactin synthase thioesterase subunit